VGEGADACDGRGGGKDWCCLDGCVGDAGDEMRGGVGGGASARRTGGLGKLSVRSPVVLALYGTGGSAAFSSSARRLSSSSCSCLLLGAGTWLPHPLVWVVAELGVAGLLPWNEVCFGGGPKLSGSFKLVKGALWCSRAYS
jgi:hypothetical protein